MTLICIAIPYRCCAIRCQTVALQCFTIHCFAARRSAVALPSSSLLNITFAVPFAVHSISEPCLAITLRDITLHNLTSHSRCATTQDPASPLRYYTRPSFAPTQPRYTLLRHCINYFTQFCKTKVRKSKWLFLLYPNGSESSRKKKLIAAIFFSALVCWLHNSYI